MESGEVTPGGEPAESAESAEPESAPRSSGSASARWLAADDPGIRPLVIVAVALVAVATWPIRPQAVTSGVDASYLMGLSMAHQRGLHFGSQVIFNFGPLGFLAGGMFARSTGVLAWLVQGTVHVGIVALVMGRLRRIVGLAVAAVAAVALLTLVHPDPAGVGLGSQMVVLAVLYALGRVVDGPVRSWSPPAAVLPALGCAMAFLVKVDAGLVATLVIGGAWLIGAWWSGATPPGRRWTSLAGPAAFAAVTVAGVVVGFAAVDGGLAHLGAWLHGVAEITTGFSGALGLTRSPAIAMWEHVGVLVGVVATAAAVTRRAPDRAQGAALSALVTATAYLAFRQGFVRYDVYHVRQYVAVAVLTPVALGVMIGRRALVALVALSVLVFVPGQRPSPRLVLEPIRSAAAAADTVATALSSSRASAAIERTRATVREDRRVPAAWLATIGDRSVAVVPDAIELAWAEDLRGWSPLPVFQDYQANTSWLDRRNAADVVGPDRPDFLLRTIGDERVDRQFPRFQPPTENLAILCHARLVSETRSLQLLRLGESRCARPVVAGDADALLGEVAKFPAVGDDEILVARFDGIGAGFADRFLTALYRGPDFFVAAGDEWYRFVPGTQRDWHVLSAPACLDRELRGTGPELRSITMSDRAGRSGSSAGYRIEFATVKVTCDEAG